MQQLDLLKRCSGLWKGIMGKGFMWVVVTMLTAVMLMKTGGDSVGVVT